MEPREQKIFWVVEVSVGLGRALRTTDYVQPVD